MTEWLPADPDLQVDEQGRCVRMSLVMSFVQEIAARARECVAPRPMEAMTLRLLYDGDSRRVRGVCATDRSGIAIGDVDWAPVAAVADRMAASYDEWWDPYDVTRLGDETWVVIDYEPAGELRSWSGPFVRDTGAADLARAVLSGVVVHAGKAVEGALVCVIPGNEGMAWRDGNVEPTDALRPGVAQALTDAEGRFHASVDLSWCHDPAVVVVAFSDARASFPREHRVRGVRDGVGTVELRASSTITVDVTSEGAPVAGAEVSVLVTAASSPATGETRAGSYWLSARTDAAGRADAGLVPTSPHVSLWLQVRDPGHPPADRVDQLGVSGDVTMVVELPAGRAVHGRLLDAGGAPVTGARMIARSAYSTHPRPDAALATADDGAFVLPGLCPRGDVVDIYFQRARAFSQPRHSIAVSRGADDDLGDVVIPPGRTLWGRLVVNGDVPQEPMSVFLGIPEAGCSGDLVGPGGEFEFDDLADISWCVHVLYEARVMSRSPQHIELRIPDDGQIRLDLDSSGLRATTSGGEVIASTKQSR